jgi:glycosyltransferase involved in cell wall biosynthesis
MPMRSMNNCMMISKMAVKIILFFGQIKNVKGLDTLLRAVCYYRGELQAQL